MGEWITKKSNPELWYDPKDKTQFWSNDNPYPRNPHRRHGSIVYDPRWEDVRDTEEHKQK